MRITESSLKPIIVLENCTIVDVQQPEPREGMQIVIEGNSISDISSSPVKLAGAQRIDLRGKFVLPGLIDCHNHIFLSEVATRRLETIPQTLMAARAVPILAQALDRGFTTLRDAGGADWGIKEAVERGIVPGPRLFISGRAMSQTGGHGDFRHRTESDLGCGCESAMRFCKMIVDGESEVRKAAREILRQGADQIKVMVSGGVASQNDPIESTQYSAGELRVIVSEASAWKTYVMAHAYTPEAIIHAVENGVRTVEHANLVDEISAKAIRKNNAYAVPTLVTYEYLSMRGADFGFPPASIEKLAHVKEAGLRSLDILKNAGVRIGFGTDLLGDLRSMQSREFVIRSEVLSPYEIICQATAVNAEILNRKGKLGVIAIGALADMIVVDGNPLKKIELLDGQGENIHMVIKDGSILKNNI